MTSAHPWNDIRIFVKECQSLAKAGFDVYIVAEGMDREEKGVHVVGCGLQPSGRRERMGEFAKKVYEKALSIDCDIYHIHDPELLPYGVKLKKLGKKVIFDSHEDVSGQILDKEWIPSFFRKIIALCYKQYETYCVKKFDAVVTATPHIKDLFYGRSKNVTDINNFPKLDDIVFQEKAFEDREPIMCYAGGINEFRGEKVMLEAMEGIKGNLILAGDYDENGLCQNKPQNVSYVGLLSREGINELYGKAIAGLVLLKPTPNYYWSRPIKMYEYMAAGLPVICSDFPLWRELLEETGAGICVPIDDKNKVREAINFVISNRKKAQQIGLNGRRCVLEKYNWENEEKKLIQLYQEL